MYLYNQCVFTLKSLDCQTQKGVIREQKVTLLVMQENAWKIVYLNSGKRYDDMINQRHVF